MTAFLTNLRLQVKRMDEPAHFEPASTRERRSPMGSLEIVVTEISHWEIESFA